MSTARPVTLSVHTLSQFAFCLRAGLLAYESRGSNQAEPEDVPLTYSPPYELMELRRQLGVLSWQKILLTLGVVGNLFLFIFLIRIGVVPLAIGILALAGIWQVRRSIALKLQRLEILLSEATGASAADIQLDASASQGIHWWQLLSAGWLSIRLPDIVHAPALQIYGRPFRVLRRGDFQIPVIRIVTNDPQDEETIYPKHLLRLYAYALLLESSFGCRSPVGIVLYGNRFSGVAIPITAEMKQTVHTALKSALSVIAKSPTGEPPPPREENCRGCQWGVPRDFVEGQSETKLHGDTIPVFGFHDKAFRLYHSTCGDRFGWVAPHATTKDLTAR